jgi:hypothetical protein
MRHAIEARHRALQAVQLYEQQMQIGRRWEAGMDEWHTAQDMASKRRLHRCLDSLESLIVSRMFELTKMNMARTGEILNLSLLTLHKLTIF